MQNVFVYGTLLFPEIVKGLCGKSFRSVNATLKDYQRLALKQRDYPAIAKAITAHVDGLILLDVDHRSFERLRFYEGPEYKCIEIEAETPGRALKAKVFVWSGDAMQLEKENWDPNSFKEKALADYVKFVIPETVLEFDRLFS